MSTRALTSFAVAGLIASLGCTKILPPLTPPEAGGPAWREVVSQHIILRTDRSEDDAKEAIEELEHTFVALHDIAFSQLDIAQSRIVVVHFDRERDLQKFAPANIAGVFFARTPGDRRNEPTMLLWGKLDAPARATLQHELTHMFAHTALGDMPIWLDEGLAQYYETLAIEDGFAYVGRPVQTKRAWSQGGFKTERIGLFITEFIPISYVPEIEKLSAMDRPAFYVWNDKGRQPELDEVHHQMGNYLGAFGLVHLLLQDEKYQPAFDRLMADVAKNVPVRRAWEAAYETLDKAKLETDYRQHLLNRYETMLLRTPYTFPKVEIALDREMPPADVHVMWARLRPWRGAELAEAEADLEAAKKLSPDSPELRRAMGRLALDKGDLDRAAAEIDAALAKLPTDADLLTDALKILRARYEKTNDATILEKAGPLLARLEKATPTGESLRFLARYQEAAGKPDLALELARKSVLTEPTCSACFATLGDILFTQHQYAEALRATTAALSLLPDNQRDLDLEAQYRKQLTVVQHPQVEPPTPPPTPAPTPAPTTPNPGAK